MAGAVLREGRLERYLCAGVRSARSGGAVDESTVFDAASLSKPVFAYAVLQLVERGTLSLDAALGDYLPDYIPTDPRASAITVETVLSHSCGLPNWRNTELPLRTYFPPGQRFSYSGEGFLYLQRAVEAVTGEKIDALLQRLVFAPLGMVRSDFVWHPRFADNRAEPHDAFGMPALGGKPGEANAAWSLQTTAADYGRFLRAVLDGSGLRRETAGLWHRPHIEVRRRGIQGLNPGDEEAATGVAWGLGWGLEPEAGTFFHWGDNGPFTAFTIGSVEQATAVVIFTNSAAGLSVMPDLIAGLMPGKRASFEWLDYVPHDAPVRRLWRAALEKGAEAVWREIESARLGEAEIRWIVHGLNAHGREADSRWLRARLK